MNHGKMFAREKEYCGAADEEQKKTQVLVRITMDTSTDIYAMGDY